MEEAVSAADANRRFSRILHEVRRGRSYLITFRGTSVARIVPVRHDQAVAAAWGALLDRLRDQPVTIVGERWIRDELYDG